MSEKSDQKKVLEWIDKAHMVQRFGFEPPWKLDILSIVDEFVTSLGKLLILRKAFSSSPGRIITGRYSVGEQLKLTRNGVEVRVKSLGLRMEDFTSSSQESIEGLVRKSSVLDPLLREIEYIHRKLTKWCRRRDSNSHIREDTRS